MAAEEDTCASSSESQFHRAYETLKEQETDRHKIQVDVLQARLMEVKAWVQGFEEDAEKELKLLSRRVKAASTLLTYLKTKARSMAVSDLVYTSCCLEKLKGLARVDKTSATLVGREYDLPPFYIPDEGRWLQMSRQESLLDEHDEADVNEMLKSVQMVTDAMGSLVERVMAAEAETAVQKKKVSLGQAEIRRKEIQIESMSLKLEEMEKFAIGTTTVLNELRQRVQDLVEETITQRQRATQNEQELCRVKRDFATLKTFVTDLITVRESHLSSELQSQGVERLLDRFVSMTTQLEDEKMQKEAEVQKLMEENVRLTSLLDKKEAQLLAMSEQFKVMALSASDI